MTSSYFVTHILMNSCSIIYALGILTSFIFQKPPFEGDYYGSWASTHWEYHFKSDSTFLFLSSGHFGNTYSIGTYQLREDTLELNSIKTNGTTDSTIEGMDRHFLNFQSDLFLLTADSCIIDLESGYDYCQANFTELITENPATKIRLYQKYRLYPSSQKRLKGDTVLPRTPEPVLFPNE